MTLQLEAGLAHDRWGSKLSQTQRQAAVRFALSRAAELWTTLSAPPDVDLVELAQHMGVQVEFPQEWHQEAGSVVYSEYVTVGAGSRPMIRVYAGSLDHDPSRIRLAIAHELLHHLESIHGRTGELFIRQQRLGWQWRLRRLRVLSELAAHQFAKLATRGTPCAS
jgi:hypothetical protein